MSVARLLEQIAGRAAAATRTPVLVSDLHPLPSSDPQGLVSFYVTPAATIVGLVTMFQLRANTAGMPITGWLGCVAALAVIGGPVLAAIMGTVRGSR